MTRIVAIRASYVDTTKPASSLHSFASKFIVLTPFQLNKKNKPLSLTQNTTCLRLALKLRYCTRAWAVLVCNDAWDGLHGSLLLSLKSWPTVLRDSWLMQLTCPSVRLKEGDALFFGQGRGFVEKTIRTLKVFRAGIPLRWHTIRMLPRADCGDLVSIWKRCAGRV
jgi:hypothetical protein